MQDFMPNHCRYHHLQLLGTFFAPSLIGPQHKLNNHPVLAGPPLLQFILGHRLPASMPYKLKPCERNCHCFILLFQRNAVSLMLSITIKEGNLPLGSIGNQQDLFIKRYVYCVTSIALGFNLFFKFSFVNPHHRIFSH